MAQPTPSIDIASLTFHPLTGDRWSDLERLFGEQGACGGCWCMYWRYVRADYEAGKGESNRRAFEQLVREGPPPGVMAYVDGVPVGWCSVAPRSSLQRLSQSYILKPVDDQPVWSVSCFFVDPAWRRAQVSLALLRAALALVKERGGRIVEGYPVMQGHSHLPPAFAWTGFVSTFLEAGFTECARRSDTRPVMRITLAD